MAVEPRPAATVILLRDGPEGLQTWLMERSRAVGFMASAWVFPGGRVEDDDDGTPVASELPPGPFWVAAVRELHEEAGVRVAVEHLRPWAHWITPEVEPRRYDTWFFVAAMPHGEEARADGQEASAGDWFTPLDAIARAQEGRLPVAPPTMRTLQELAPFAAVADVLAAPRRLPPICPRYGQDADGNVFVLLPGDPEHPATDPVDPPYRYVFSQGRWWAR